MVGQNKSEASTLQRAASHARAFDDELVRLGLVRNKAKDLNPCTAGVWLGIKFDMCTHRLSTPVMKICHTRAYFLVVITDNTGVPPRRVKVGNLQVLVRKLSCIT